MSRLFNVSVRQRFQDGGGRTGSTLQRLNLQRSKEHGCRGYLQETSTSDHPALLASSLTLWDPSLGLKMNAAPLSAELVDTLMFKLSLWYVSVCYISEALKHADVIITLLNTPTDTNENKCFSILYFLCCFSENVKQHRESATGRFSLRNGAREGVCFTPVTIRLASFLGSRQETCVRTTRSSTSMTSSYSTSGTATSCS